MVHQRFQRDARKAFPKNPIRPKAPPTQPYISKAEAAQFRKSIEAYCKSDSKSYQILYRKVYEYYGITSYKHIPAGKLEEAAKLCGMKLLKLVKPRLPKEQAETPVLTFTPDELELLVAERVKALESEVMPKPEPQQDAIHISINGGMRMMTVIFEGKVDKMARYLVQVEQNYASIHALDMKAIAMTEAKWIEYMTQEKGYLVMKKNGSSSPLNRPIKQILKQTLTTVNSNK